MIYNIGQMLTLKEDRELKGEISGTVKNKKAGTEVFIGASQRLKMAHYINGDVEILPDDTEIKGFSAKGLAEWLYIWLRNRFEIDEMLDNYEDSKENFTEKIVEALEELGFYNHEGNIG